MDGEPEPAAQAQVDAHLDGCSDCRAWQSDATALTRTLRVRPAVRTPDLSQAVLEAAPRRRKPPWTRIALGVVAAMQILLSLSQMLGLGGHMHVDGHAGSHLFNESTSWNLALGLGLGWAAVSTRAATGMLAPLGVFLVMLTGFSVHDLASGAAIAGRVGTHGLLVVAFALLYAVHRGQRSGDGPRPDRIGAPGESGTASGDEEVPERSGHGRPSPPLRPSAEHGERRAA